MESLVWNLIFLVIGLGLGSALMWLWARQKSAIAEALLEKERDSHKRLQDSFAALSTDALKNNSQTFLELARESLSKYQQMAQGDLEKRQTAIEQIVKPVKETLDKFDSRVQELEKARVGAYEGLNQQVKYLLQSQGELRAETANLVKALRAPHVRGRWGEIQLRRVVEMAGMLNHCDFEEQTSTTTETGALRPDLIVKLPGGKNIIVDSKVVLSAYLEALEARSEEERVQKLREHAQQVRKRIEDLSRKSYWDQFSPAPEFVVLFLPGETFFSAALEMDPGLIEMGVGQKVILATPTTLIALLKSVAYGWRQEKMAENAAKVGELGKELYKRVGDLAGHFDDLGKKLKGAVESYNKSVGTMETRVLVSARRFRELEVAGAQDEIETLPTIDQQPRQLQMDSEKD